MSTTAARSFVLLFAVALAVITPATLARAETTTTAALYAVTPRPPVPTRPARPAAPCLPGTPIGGTVGSVGGPPLELTAGCYVVTSDISVPANVTFTIDPAVTLQFNGNLGLFINGGGTLSADASADPNSPSITFTTNNPVPAPGQWMGVYFQSNSAGIISNALVQFAGANRGAGQFGIRVDANSAPTLDTLIVDSGSGLGIDVEGGCPAVTNDTITNNASYGLFLNTNLACDPSLANLTYSGNGNNNWIYLNGSGLSGARTLPNVGADYFLPNDISVPNQASLTIMDPGVVLHFTTGTGLFVNGGGTLIIDASADPTNPTLLTTSNPTPAPGQWMGVYFQGNGGGTLNTVIVQFAGANRGAGQFGIRIDSAPALTNVTVTQSSGFGIYTEVNATPTIGTSSVTNSSSDGVHVGGSSCPAISNPTITNNGGYGLFLGSGIQCDPGLTGLSPTTYSGNGFANHIALTGGGSVASTGRTTLSNYGFNPLVYDALSDFSVANGGTLTIQPAVTLRFASGVGVFVNGGGRLVADASSSPTTPIVFTTINASPAPGQWMGVYFQGNSSGMLNTVIVQFAGTNRGAGQFGIRIDSAPTLANVTVTQNAVLGIEVENGCPTITSGTITNNASYGLYLNTNLACDPSLANLTYSGNGNNNWIYLNGSGLSGARTLPNVGAEYFLPNDISVPNLASLTVRPGVVLHFTSLPVPVYL